MNTSIFTLFGGRKAGIVGLTIAAVMSFMGTGIITPENQDLALMVVGIIIIAYIVGNIIKGHPINGGDGDEVG